MLIINTEFFVSDTTVEVVQLLLSEMILIEFISKCEQVALNDSIGLSSLFPSSLIVMEPFWRFIQPEMLILLEEEIDQVVLVIPTLPLIYTVEFEFSSK